MAKSGAYTADGRKVAMKKMILKEQQLTKGIDFSAIREIRIMRELNNDYLVNVRYSLLFLHQWFTNLDGGCIYPAQIHA